jgi:hypothetical protein
VGPLRYDHQRDEDFRRAIFEFRFLQPPIASA